MQYGIPNFRLDKEIVKKSIEEILDDNINVEYNSILCSDEALKLQNVRSEDEKLEQASTQIDNLSHNIAISNEKSHYITINQLKEQGYEYFFLAFGCKDSVKLDIEGVNSKFVFSANEFLKKTEEEKKEILNDKETVIIGGGNVAIDSARTAIRYGKKSTIIYRRKKENMPANKSEILDAENEKVNFVFQKNVIRIIENDDNKLTLILDDETEFQTDILIMAIGSKINNNYLDKTFLLDEKNKIIVDENFETNIKNIFAGGDVTAKDLTVANALKNGKIVAQKIAENIKK